MISLKKMAKAVSVVSFVADLITVAVFVYGVLFSAIPPTAGSVIAQVAIISVMFAFAIILLGYSVEEMSSLNGIILIYSWLYILFSALVLLKVAIQFLNQPKYDFGEYLAYVAVIVSIAFLGNMTAKAIEVDNKYFTLPFMGVALVQIFLWIVRVLSKGLNFDWAFIGNLGLLILSGLFVVYFLVGNEKESKD